MADTREPELSSERFETLVASYGGDIERFPVRERTRARALAARSRDAQRMLEAARTLDALLITTRAVAVPRGGFEARLKAIALEHAQERGNIATLLPFRSGIVASLAAAAAMLLGVLGSDVWPDDASDPSLERTEIRSLALEGKILDDLTWTEGGRK